MSSWVACPVTDWLFYDIRGNVTHGCESVAAAPPRWGHKRWKWERAGRQSAPAGTTSHQEIQSFPRHQEQTSSYISSTRTVTWPLLATLEDGRANTSLSPFPGWANLGGFVSTRKLWHGRKDNFAFLENHHRYDEWPEPFMLNVDLLMFCWDVSCFCSPRGGSPNCDGESHTPSSTATALLSLLS